MTFISGSEKFEYTNHSWRTGVNVQIDESQFKHKPKVSRILIYFTNINIIVLSITAS